jgi:hypothetical protein
MKSYLCIRVSENMRFSSLQLNKTFILFNWIFQKIERNCMIFSSALLPRFMKTSYGANVSDCIAPDVGVMDGTVVGVIVGE